MAKSKTQAAPKMDVGAATAALKAIPDGKVVDFISGRLLDDTPEEYVRQNVEMSLVLEYSYPRDQVEVEFRIKVGSGTKELSKNYFDNLARSVRGCLLIRPDPAGMIA